MAKYCTQCGRETGVGQRFCVGCGAPTRGARYCYSCAAANDTEATRCARCGRELTPTRAVRIIGTAYALNSLDDWTRSDAIDEQSAARMCALLADQMSALSGTLPSAERAAPRPVAPAAPAAWTTPVRDRPVYRSVPIMRAAPAAPSRDVVGEAISGVSTFATEQTPSLLLYLGAFLLVTSALIFVSVSGAQISELTKLVLMLGGTLGFLGAGWVCDRIPRVRPAGRTFLVIGALLAPLDVLAYYALSAGASPLTSPDIWLIGSLLTAGLYAALTLLGYGRWYAYLFFIAMVSASFAFAFTLHLRSPWWPVVLLALALGLLVAARFAARLRAQPLLAPLALPALALATLVAVPQLSAAATGAVLGSDAEARWALDASAVLASACAWAFGWARYGWLAIAALASPAAVVFATLYAVDAPIASFGVASAVLGVAYAVIDRVHRTEGIRALEHPRAAHLTWISNALAFGSLLFLADYERAAVSGAVALGALAAFCGMSALWAERRTGMLRAELDRPLLYASALVLHGAWRYLLMALPSPQGGRLLAADAPAIDLATAFFPLALALGIATTAGAWRRVAHADAAALATAVSMTVVAALSLDDPVRHTAFMSAFAAVALAWAVVSRRPGGLWAAAPLVALAVFGALRWTAAPIHAWPGAFTATGLALAVLASVATIERNGFARALRAIAAASQLVAVATGYYWIIRALGHGAFTIGSEDTPLLASGVALAALAVLGVRETRDRRNDRAFLIAATCVIVALLMQVAAVAPDVQALSTPAGLYLLGAAFAIRRSVSRLAGLVVPLEVAACATLAIPAALDEPAWSGNVLVLEALAFVLLGLWQDRPQLVSGGILAALAGALVAAAGPADHAIYSGVLGAVLTVIAFVARRRRLTDDRRLAGLDAAGAVLFLAGSAGGALSLDPYIYVLALLAQSLALVAFGLRARLHWPTWLALGGVALAILAGIAYDRARVEPAAVFAGLALVALPFVLRLSAPLDESDRRGAEVIAAFALLALPASFSFTKPSIGDPQAIALVAGSVALVLLGVLTSRPALALAGGGGLVASCLRPVVDADRSVLPALLGGAVAVAIGVLARRRRLLSQRALVALDASAAIATLGPVLYQTSLFRSPNWAVYVSSLLLVAVGAWAGSRVFLLAPLLTAVLATSSTADAARSPQPYAMAWGALLLAATIAATRARLVELARYDRLMVEHAAAGLFVLPALMRITDQPAPQTALFFGTALVVLLVALVERRRELLLSTVVVLGLGATRTSVLEDPLPAITAGAGAILLAIAVASGRRRSDAFRHNDLLILEVAAAAIFAVPSFLRSWAPEGFAYGAALLVQALVLVGIGSTLHRQWLLGAGVLFVGIQAMRAAVDIVNRLPNWLLLGISGALLLAIGFVLTLKRDAWLRWRSRALGWWQAR